MMKTIKMILLMVVPFVAQISVLVAQEEQSVVPGARVRVTAPGIAPDRMMGTAISLDVDTLVMKAEGRTAPLAVPIASVTRLDLSRGRIPRGKNALKGAGIGLLVGGLGGYVVEVAVEGDQAIAPIVGAIGGAVNGSLIGAGGKSATIGFLSGLIIGGVIGGVSREGDISTEDSILIGASFVGEIGIIIGGLAGLASDAERWKKVPLERVRIGLLPHHGNWLKLSASFTF